MQICSPSCEHSEFQIKSELWNQYIITNTLKYIGQHILFVINYANNARNCTYQMDESMHSFFSFCKISQTDIKNTEIYEIK